MTITFSESVLDFLEGEVSVSNGTLSGFSGSGSVYTANVIPAMSGPVSVSVGVSVAQDVAGNGNLASSVLTINFLPPPGITGFATLANAVCVDSPITFTATIGNVTGTYTYTITNGASTTTGASSAINFNERLVASGSGSQSFTLIVNNNDQSSTATLNVTVTSLPTTGLTNNGPLSCSLTTVTLTASGGDSYTFANGTGTILTGTGNTRTVNTPGTYWVRAANASGCVSTTSTTVTQDNNLPTASISPSSATLTCTNPSATLTASGGNSYRWDDNSTNPIRSVSTSGTYSVTVTASNGCTAVASASVSQDSNLPTASVSPSSATLTCANPSVTLTASGGVSYRWDDNSTNPIRSVSTSGTYSVTVTSGNGCTAVASASVSQDSNLPTASISPSSATLTCTNPSVTLTASGGVSYRWDDNSTNPIRSVSTSGTYSVTVTSGNGCTAVASASVSQDSNLPTASVSPSSATLTCANPSVTLTASGGVSYRWDDNSTNPIRSVSTSGTYSVTVTSGNGCTAVASASVSQDSNLPTASISPSSATLTCTNPSATLTASGGNSYRWDDNSTNPIRSVSTSGTYSVTVTSGNGCTAVASAQVSQDSNLPTASISPSSATLTCSAPSATLTASGGVSYRWNDNSTNPIRSVSTSGTYSVTVTASNGCTAVASASVSQDSNLPTASVSPSSATLTCANPSVTLTASGGNSYRWDDNSTNPIRSVSTSGTYSVTVTASNGCTAVASASVSQDSNLPTASISPSSATLTCASPNATLTASGGNSYRWNDNSTNPIRSVSTSGTYSVTVTSGNGCTAVASASVSQDSNLPTASISPSSATLTCTNPSVTLTASGGVSYRWNDNSTNPIRSVSTSGTYSVTVTASNGCTAVASASVSQDSNLPTASVSPSSATLTCANPSVTLTASGGNSYRWDDNSTNPIRSVSTSGTYSVTVTASNGCTAVASASVSQDSNLPTASISPSSATLTCASPNATLTASGGNSYRWDDNSTNPIRSVSTSGTYSVTVTSGNGCTAVASAQVSQDSNLPTASISPSSATLTCSAPSATLTASGGVSYRWNDNSTNPIRSVSTSGTYSVTVTSGNGCTAIASAQVFQNSTLPTVSISANPSLTIAPGQSTTLTATGASAYTWNTGENSAAITVTAPGLYSVTGIAGNGCSATASVVVSPTTTPAGSFTITGVSSQNCQQIAANRYVITFTPQYSGTNGQPISFSVVNELFPTTAAGPYSLQLYTDNPVIVLTAQQAGTAGEARFSYNWLANCTSSQPNTPPRVNQPLSDQLARVGEGFGYSLPQLSFTDNETPQSLVLTVSGLPAGLSFLPPSQIGGVPSVAGVSSVTVTATDPGGLRVSTQFVLTVVEANASNTPPTVVSPISAQVATQGQPFGLNVSNTFTDAQTPNALTLTAGGLPAGLQLVGGQISGTPSVTGTSTITLTAVDAGGLSASTSFVLTVNPVSGSVSAPFAITGVTPIYCNQISANRYAISFQPQYSGLTGQAVSFWVVNELFPTTAGGPYSLQLYNDNPTIVLKATQPGSAGEASFTYNWLATCQSPQPNTAPRVNQPLSNQTAKVGEGFGYSIPQTTFTDNETPHSLVLTVGGLPAGLSFSPPAQIGGVPSMSGVSTITVTATDPQGLSVSTSFVLSVSPASSTVVVPPTPTGFGITGVTLVNCESLSGNRRRIQFSPQYSGLDGSPVSFSVVNELLPTTAGGPYTLELYTDNATLQLRAQQGGASASYAYNWLAGCTTSGRQAVSEKSSSLRVVVLGNPVEGDQVGVRIEGANEQAVSIRLYNEQGKLVNEQLISETEATTTHWIRLGSTAGVYLLEAKTPFQRQLVKIIKQ
ncbi:hypothetical protein GCM10028807_48930 [Spirosoma daeguense]